MQVETMRHEIAMVYDGPAWKNKVSRMYDNQVIAIWHKFSEDGKIEEAIKRKQRDGKQLSMFD